MLYLAAMLNILAVHPPYPGDPAIKYMPLGFGLVLAIAKREHRVTLLDLLNDRATWADVERTLEQGEYDVCLMGGFAMQVEAMREVTRLAREKSPRTKVVVGGVGVSDIPKIVLDYTGADAVAMGECESVLPQLFQSIEAGQPFEGVPTFAYRRGEEIVQNPKGPLIKNLDDLGWPAYELFDMDYISQRSYNGWGRRSAFMETSRGCPFRCDFCINSVLNDKDMQKMIYGNVAERNTTLRLRSTDSLGQEIEFLKRTYGITDIVFSDEEFMTQKARVFEVCEGLKPLGITWMTSGRVDWANTEKLQAMKDVGCRGIMFGVETGSQTMMDLMHKSAKKDRVVAGLNAARGVGINFIANFMIAHPGETERTIEESVEFCREQELAYLPAYTTLFPNSKMFHENKGLVKSWDWYFKTLARVQFNSNLLVNLTDIPDARLRQLRDTAVARSAAYLLLGKERHRLVAVATPVVRAVRRLAEKLPPGLRYILRNLVRGMLDLRRKPARQIAPYDLARVEPPATADSYEESLQQLQKADLVAEHSPADRTNG